jgi:PAS domain S-box-containing protein
MNHFISNDVIITEKELLGEIVRLKEKIRELENERRNQRKIINQYKTIFPKISKPMFLTDVEGKIIDTNNEFANLLGYTFFDLKRMTIRSITPKDLHENEMSVLYEELNSTKTLEQRPAEYIKINGEKVKVEIEIIATFDERNNLDSITRIVKNIL